MQNLHTVKDLAIYFNVTRQSVHKWIANGKVSVIKTPTGRIRIEQDEWNRVIRGGVEMNEESNKKLEKILGIPCKFTIDSKVYYGALRGDFIFLLDENKAIPIKDVADSVEKLDIIWEEVPTYAKICKEKDERMIRRELEDGRLPPTDEIIAEIIKLNEKK